MKVVTFNIRCDYSQDGANNFCYRKPLILKKLAQENPDVICFQEVLPHVAVWLKENLTEYYVVGCPRGELLDGEQVSVAYKKDKYSLMKMDTYWLSETPYTAGSRYEDQSECPRVCTEVVLHELKSGKVFRLVNTHLDHIGSLARKFGVAQILRQLEAETFFAQVPVIVTGDFNAEPESEEIQLIEQYPEFVNAAKEIGITYHGYGSSNTACIDYIYIKGGLVQKSVEKWTDVENGVYLSDHYPICAELEFQEI